MFLQRACPVFLITTKLLVDGHGILDFPTDEYLYLVDSFIM